jgi:hypothetical protein
MTLLDGIGMMLFFSHIYSISRVFQIFIKEVSYKAVYTTLFLALIYGIRGIVTNMQPMKSNSLLAFFGRSKK